MPTYFELFGDNDPIRRFWGTYHATVDSIADPDQRGRIKVKCPEVFGNSISPWCEYDPPYGGSPDLGFFMIPDRGANVVIQFKGGNPALPIYFGSGNPRQGQPFLAKGRKDGSRDNKGKVTYDSFRDDSKIQEPEDSYRAEYGLNRTIKTKSGHILEFDDTAGAERLNIHHKSGSYIEFQPDGTMLVNVRSKKIESHESDVAINSKGNADYKFDKDIGILIDGNGNIKIEGNLSMVVNGDLSLYSNGTLSLAGKAGVNIASPRDIVIISKDSLVLNSKNTILTDSD